MEDPSIRTHDRAFEQALTLGIIAVIIIAVAISVAVYLHHRDRRY